MSSSFRVVNVYGTYVDKFYFGDGLSESGTLKSSNVNIGEDLNFTLSLREVWGRHYKRGPLEGFFAHWIENHHLVDLEPPKMSQTWRNRRKGDDLVSKRLDRFLLAECFLENTYICKSSVMVGGILDHMLILLNIRKIGFKPPSPFKFN
jgi:hypothetical protein